MGVRMLRFSAGFFPVLMSKGVHHYSLWKDSLPEDAVIVEARMGGPNNGELLLWLESEDWEEAIGVPAPEVKLSFVENHCP